LLITLSVVSCGNITEYSLTTYGIAKESHSDSLLFFNTVESSIVTKNNSIEYLYDYGMSGNGLLYFSAGTAKKCDIDARFPYTLKRNNLYYTFGLKDNAIYVYESVNGYDYIPFNSGNPILTKSTDKTSIWYNIWNVGVVIDDNNIMHVLVECGPEEIGQEKVCLSYVQCAFNNDMNLDVVKTEDIFISGGGNPYLYYDAETREIMIIYGMLNNSFNDLNAAHWWVASAIYSIDSKTLTRTDEKLSFGNPDIHVCDPHLAEFVDTTGTVKTMLIFSYDQNTVYSMIVDSSLKDIYKSIK